MIARIKRPSPVNEKPITQPALKATTNADDNES
jgi:hypothetical protein